MSAASGTDWRADFGIDAAVPPRFYTAEQQLTAATPQAHLLRRAFDVFKVDVCRMSHHGTLFHEGDGLGRRTHPV